VITVMCNPLSHIAGVHAIGFIMLGSHKIATYTVLQIAAD